MAEQTTHQLTRVLVRIQKRSEGIALQKLRGGFCEVPCLILLPFFSPLYPFSLFHYSSWCSQGFVFCFFFPCKHVERISRGGEVLRQLELEVEMMEKSS